MEFSDIYMALENAPSDAMGVAIVAAYVRDGGDVNALNVYPSLRSLAFATIERGNNPRFVFKPATMLYLLQLGSNPNAVSADRHSLLDEAKSSLQADIVTILLQHGARSGR